MTRLAARNLFLAGVLLILLLVELYLGSVGVVLPLTMGIFFYATVAYGWRCGLTAALIAAVITDLVLGRSFPVTFFAAGAMAAAASRYCRDRIPDLPDVVLPALRCFCAPAGIFLLSDLWVGVPVWQALLHLLIWIPGGTLLLVLECWGLDFLGDKLDLPVCIPALCRRRNLRSDLDGSGRKGGAV